MAPRSALFVLFVLVDVRLIMGGVVVIAPNKARLETVHQIFLYGDNLEDDQRQYLVRVVSRRQPLEPILQQTHQIENGVPKAIDLLLTSSNTGTATEVYLKVESTTPGGFNEETEIEVDRHPGYIFVQLDKPIYTSRQVVKYRVIGVDEDLKFARWPIEVSLLNPRDHLIDRVTKTPQEAFKASTFHLSKRPMKGIWKVRAAYQNVSTESITPFEVRDYVLPRFGVEVKANYSSIHSERSTPLKLSVKAEYVYGRPVIGEVSMAIVGKRRRRQDTDLVIPQRSYQLNSSGQVDVVINDAEIKDAQTVQPYLHRVIKLYASVNVTESSTGNVVREEIQVATIARSPYIMNPVNMKNNYKPGLPYDFEVEVTNIDGSLAKRVPFEVKVEGQLSTTVSTDNKGRFKQTFNGPTDGRYLEIEFYPEEYGDDEAKCYDISPEESQIDRYLKLETPQNVPVNRDLVVTVRYNQLPGQYILMVVSRGRVIYQRTCSAGSGSHDNQVIPSQYLKRMSPRARILVFYMTGNTMVADSHLVFVKPSCIEELNIQDAGEREEYKPKEQSQLQVRGGPRMQVGLVAVDEAVYKITDDRFTRAKLFSNLGAHDMGIGSGDVSNVFKIFASAGFRLMVSQTGGRVPETHSTPSRAYAALSDTVVRSFFPESWMFQETELGSDGVSLFNITFPDSITTWIMYAVGVSENGGVCVSEVEKITVFKKFFVDIDLPFKVVRLEEVKVKVTVSNYLGFDIRVDLTATAGGLCTLDSVGGNWSMSGVRVANEQKTTKEFDVLAVKSGTYTILVSARTQVGSNVDVVQKTLRVVSDGQPQKKTITFNLDPEGEPRRDLTVTQSVDHNIQNTSVELAFPYNTIVGSEEIQIIAAGDILGNVISNFVLGSNLATDFDGAQGLMMHLAPSCSGVQYLAEHNLLTNEVLAKGRQHIKHGRAQLMKYRTDEGAFSLDEIDEEFDTEPSTWFTAFVLRTLCGVRSVIDFDNQIITEGYRWLWSQVTESSSGGFTVEENDPRVMDENRTQVLTEILLSSHSCSHEMRGPLAHNMTEVKNWFIQRHMDRYHSYDSLNTLAKVTFALLQLDGTCRMRAVRHLSSKKTVTNEGYIFWTEAATPEEEHPFFQNKPDAETIETTAYSLMVFIDVAKRCCTKRRHSSSNRCRRFAAYPEKIADWLTQWRNGDGLFVADTDTAAATEALAMYRDFRRIAETNLQVNVTTHPSDEFHHRLVFSQDDAFRSQILSDVPLGQELRVRTAGSGLGQMHADVSYNVPIDPNANCQFSMTVSRYSQAPIQFRGPSIYPGRRSLCDVCGSRLTCPKGDKFRCQEEFDGYTVRASAIYCLRVCVKKNGEYDHKNTFIRIPMLSGFVPADCDLQELEGGNVAKASYDNEKDFVQIRLKKVSFEHEDCVGFRIKKVQDVYRIKPATVTLRSSSGEDWTCPRQYTSDESAVSNPFYCALNTAMLECSCFNDQCVDCSANQSPRLRELRQKAENSMFVFRLRVLENVAVNNLGVNRILFNVEEVLKNCVDTEPQTQVLFVSKRQCSCPNVENGVQYWVMGKDYNKYTNEAGVTQYHYYFNCDTFLLSSETVDNFVTLSRDIRTGLRLPEELGC